MELIAKQSRKRTGTYNAECAAQLLWHLNLSPQSILVFGIGIETVGKLPKGNFREAFHKLLCEVLCCSLRSWPFFACEDVTSWFVPTHFLNSSCIPGFSIVTNNKFVLIILVF